jgi:AraC family transcriptional regulator
VQFAKTFASELASPTEPIFAESLSLAFSLHLLSEHGRSSGKKVLSPKGKLSSFQLRSVSTFVHESLATGLSLEDMTAVTNLTPFHFSRLFKKTTGISPHQYVLQQRLQRATRYLGEGILKLADIALLCGFYDQAHMTIISRKAFGKTPLYWK